MKLNIKMLNFYIHIHYYYIFFLMFLKIFLNNLKKYQIMYLEYYFYNYQRIKKYLYQIKIIKLHLKLDYFVFQINQVYCLVHLQKIKNYLNILLYCHHYLLNNLVLYYISLIILKINFLLF